MSGKPLRTAVGRRPRTLEAASRDPAVEAAHAHFPVLVLDEIDKMQRTARRVATRSRR